MEIPKIHRSGILFYIITAERISILLAERRGSLVWDIPDGERIESDQDPWMTAMRHASDALCGMPGSCERRFSLTFPLGIFTTRRTVFAAELPTYPEHGDCWNLDHHEGSMDYRQFAWYDLHALPRRTRWLLYPVLWRLWFLHRNLKVPRRAPKPREILNRRMRVRAFRSRVRHSINRLFGRH
jgi:hypothetical protein